MLLWFLLGLAQAQDDCSSCPMNDVGATLQLPSGWRMTRWSDWDFKAKSKDGGITVELWLTPFQVEVSEESAEAWAQLYVKRIEGSGGGDAKVQETSTTEIEGRPWAR
ncbi:MAG: hypothetical protein QGG40_15120, partial [Myxococcota bacterium]|nr:hypothetical protein [Myxococcota bacterium]